MARQAVQGRLPRPARLRAGADIRRVIRRGRRMEAGPYVVHGLPAPSPGGSRITVVVPRRVGTPVVRNRIKRVFREAFRQRRVSWRHDWDVVVYVRSSPKLVTLQRAVEVLAKAVRAFEAASLADA